MYGFNEFLQTESDCESDKVYRKNQLAKNLAFADPYDLAEIFINIFERMEKLERKIKKK